MEEETKQLKPRIIRRIASAASRLKQKPDAPYPAVVIHTFADLAWAYPPTEPQPTTGSTEAPDGIR